MKKAGGEEMLLIFQIETKVYTNNAEHMATKSKDEPNFAIDGKTSSSRGTFRHAQPKLRSVQSVVEDAIIKKSAALRMFPRSKREKN